MRERRVLRISVNNPVYAVNRLVHVRVGYRVYQLVFVRGAERHGRIFLAVGCDDYVSVGDYHIVIF